MSDYMSLLLDETRRLFHAVVEARGESLGRAGLAPIERQLLEALARERTTVTATALARRTLITLSEVVPGLRSLDERGWLDSSSRASNRRWTEGVGLSDEGRDAWRALQANEQQVLRKLAEALDEQRARTTLTTLRHLRRTLQRQDSQARLGCEALSALRDQGRWTRNASIASVHSGSSSCGV